MCDHDLINAEPLYIINNVSNLDIIDWVPPYYVQAALGVTSSYLLNVFYFRFT